MSIENLMEVTMVRGQLKRIYEEDGEAALLEILQNTFRGIKPYGFTKEWLNSNRSFMVITGEVGKIIVKW